MSQEKISIKAKVEAPKKKVWEYYTNPEHIIKWNFADPSWHCPTATNELKIGGRFFARMEAKDKSEGFDFEAIYTQVQPEENFSYGFAERTVDVEFKTLNPNQTEITVTFDPETENPIELQKNGWQAILDNFKNYTEKN